MPVAQMLRNLLLTQPNTQGPDVKAEKGKISSRESLGQDTIPFENVPSTVLHTASARGDPCIHGIYCWETNPLCTAACTHLQQQELSAADPQHHTSAVLTCTKMGNTSTLGASVT